MKFYLKSPLKSLKKLRISIKNPNFCHFSSKKISSLSCRGTQYILSKMELRMENLLIYIFWVQLTTHWQSVFFLHLRGYEVTVIAKIWHPSNFEICYIFYIFFNKIIEFIAIKVKWTNTPEESIILISNKKKSKKLLKRCKKLRFLIKIGPWLWGIFLISK